MAFRATLSFASKEFDVLDCTYNPVQTPFGQRHLQKRGRGSQTEGAYVGKRLYHRVYGGY